MPVVPEIAATLAEVAMTIHNHRCAVDGCPFFASTARVGEDWKCSFHANPDHPIGNFMIARYGCWGASGSEDAVLHACPIHTRDEAVVNYRKIFKAPRG